MDGKKSFLLYCDLIHTVEQLPDDKAGQLFKHLLMYVNDLHPTSNDPLINIAFEPIKQQLKRDLSNWESKKLSRVEAGRKGGLAKASKASKAKQSLANLAVNDTVTVTVNDTVTVKEEKKTTSYLSGGHLSISLEDFGKLEKRFGHDRATEYCHNVLNWPKNNKVKSLYFTALKWLTRDNVQDLNEPTKELTEYEKAEAHKLKVKKENGWI